jgi:hypothetical protein
MIVNRAELLKLTSRKLKANLRQLLAVLENNLVQEESALHFNLYGFRLECMALLNTTIVQIMSAWTRATGLEPTKSNWNSIACLIPIEILAKVRLSKSVEETSRVPQFGSRVLNEVAVMLEHFIIEKGSNAVNGLQRFSTGLVWTATETELVNRRPAGKKRENPCDQRSVQ